MKRIGFIGAGKMAQALAQGFIKKANTKNTLIRASCDPKDIVSIKGFQNLGCNIIENNTELVETSDVVIFAVKPTILENIIKEIKHVAKKDQLFLSVAMGIPLAKIEKILGPGYRVIRVMPNTPVSVGAGASVYCLGSTVQQEDIEFTKSILQSVGTCHLLPEHLLDSVTGLSGSGPAYVYMIIESMADGGVNMGIPRDLALKLATQTVFGAGKTVIETGQHPAVLRENVTSPSGTTSAGLFSLETNRIRSAFIEAIEKATKRAREISNEMHKIS